jgi:phosphatidylethanolamine-binding protein (PEBP) family uncharacterized protein
LPGQSHSGMPSCSLISFTDIHGPQTVRPPRIISICTSLTPHSSSPHQTMSVTSDITSLLTANQIIPDILPQDTFTPSVFFTVIYSDTNTETNLGNEVQRSHVLNEPEITITPLNVPEADGGEVRYTLVMADPDAPKRFEPKYRQWRHWVVCPLRSCISLPTDDDLRDRSPDYRFRTLNLEKRRLYTRQKPNRQPHRTGHLVRLPRAACTVTVRISTVLIDNPLLIVTL